MKRVIPLLLFLFLLISLFIGCNDETVKETDNKRIKNNERTVAKDQKTVLAEQVLDSLKQLEKSIKEQDMGAFLAFQNEGNVTFYKEQQRWLEEVIFKSQREYDYNLSVIDVNLDSLTTGLVTLKIDIRNPVGELKSHLVTYQIIHTEKGWKLNDLPFETLSYENMTVYYLAGHASVAKTIMEDAENIIALYQQTFGWKPEHVSIKLYNEAQQMAATIPWSRLASWNEVGESLKVLNPISKDRTFQILTHELAHQMLGNMTNNNASPYLQEGLATLLEQSVSRNYEGELVIDFQKANEKAYELIDKMDKRFLTIDELNQKAYDEGAIFYSYGFLLTNYLIQTEGIATYLKMTEELAEQPYLDQRIEHKLENINPLTTQVLEAVYGEVENISEAYQGYYLDK